MIRTFTRLAVIAGLIAFCSTVIAKNAAERNAELYTQVAQHQTSVLQTQLDARIKVAENQALADVAALNACASTKEPGMCIAMVQSNVLARTILAGQAPLQTPIVPPWERDMAAKFKDMMAAPLQMMGIGMQSYERVELAKVSQQGQYQQYQFLAQMNAQSAQAIERVATASVANAQPVYNVGGDFAGGNLQNGDATNINGNGNATNGSQIGDNVQGEAIATHGGQIGDDIDVSGDQNAVDGVIDNHVVDVSGIYLSGASGNNTETGEGDQRIESPGPFDDHSDDGDDCFDSECSPDGGAP